jgi:hypothetical protein
MLDTHLDLGNMKEVFNPSAWGYHQVGVFSFDFEWNWNMRLPSSGTCGEIWCACRSVRLVCELMNDQTEVLSESTGC